MKLFISTLVLLLPILGKAESIVNDIRVSFVETTELTIQSTSNKVSIAISELDTFKSKIKFQDKFVENYCRCMGSPRFILKSQTEDQIVTAFKGDGIYYKGKIIILEPESKKWLEYWLKDKGYSLEGKH